MNYYSDILVNKDAVKEIRMFDLADTFIDKYKIVFNEYYRGLRKLILSENIWHISIGILANVANLAFFVIIAHKVFSGAIMIGDYTLYTGAITSLAACVSTLITNSAVIYEGTLFIDNLISFMDEKPTVVSCKAEPEIASKGTPHTIELVNVSFRYPGTDRDILKNINLKFNPGETVVLVGLNGAGKTTLIKLLTRLYDPTEGYILLDGKDLREYDVKSLYSLYGIIFQDFGKYAVSVSDNIRFGDIHKEVNEDNIRAAAVQSNAHDYISRMPDGYETPLMRIFEQTGTELSIGQWQKLAIARAFYSDSDILILDEPTASLDPLAEQEIFNQFDRLRADKTTIFVSHRLSSATIASLIVVLEHGEVVECGNHKELMSLGGKYFELFSTQAKRYLESQE
jgi:ABC-type multidrug transport system fused ATPase/permease subunit